jgi:NADH-ubiquinone oxidoreductase chain 5
MAAPTPVSALVHSSTLVTAGVYLIIRFNQFYISRGINFILLYLAVLTMIMSGIIANVEIDLKKIIALSTLRQLGLIIIILRLGRVILGFYHLLIHAIFKSLLFICAGVIIHSIRNNQDIRFLGNINKSMPLIIIIFLITNLALCGFPFIAGFYSKDVIIEIVYSLDININILILIIISLIFTVIYSFRLMYYIFFMRIKFYRYIRIKEEKLINLSILILIILRVIIGSLIR